MLATDAKALIYQVPGGMLSNLLSQLKQAGKEDKLTEVLEAVSYTHLEESVNFRRLNRHSV